MDNNLNQQNGSNENNDSMMSKFNNAVNYNMGNAMSKPNYIIGAIAALVISALGVGLYILLGYAANMVFFIMGAVILAAEVFVFEKTAKGIDIIGMAICIVFALVSVYLGTKFATIFAVKGQLKDIGINATYKVSKVAFDKAWVTDSAFKADYIKNMALGYVFSIVYIVAFVFGKNKKRK